MSFLSRGFPFIALATLLFVPSPAAAAESTPAQEKPPVIILKLDDLTAPTPAWKRTVEFLKERHVKSSIGIICKSLETGDKSYFDWVKAVEATGLVEFWHHGWTHAKWKEDGKDVFEFKGASYEQQKQNIEQAMKMAKEKLGITFRSFGAPFNAFDDSTLRALSENSDLKVLLYGYPSNATATPNLLVLDRTPMNIENPLFVPNAKRIESDYSSRDKNRKYFVIQGNPGQWDDARFEEFKKLVDYLITQGVTFTTPYEYYQSKQSASSTN